MPVSKVITANAQKHGTAVVWVGDTGSSGTIHSETYNPNNGSRPAPMTITQLSGQYLNRFNDVNYYTHSGVF